MVTILISTQFRGRAYLRVALILIWAPKRVVLILGQRLFEAQRSFEAWHLLEEIL